MPMALASSNSWLRVVSATVRESVLIVQRTPARTRRGSGCSARLGTPLHFQFAVGHRSSTTPSDLTRSTMRGSLAPITPCAILSTPRSSVEEALDLGVERTAHGVIGARDPRIVERVRSEGVVLDLCPTANWKCKAVPSLAEHPLPRLVRAGVRCTISTDSRTVADTTLSREFELASAMGLRDEELRRCNAIAYEAKFG